MTLLAAEGVHTDGPASVAQTVAEHLGADPTIMPMLTAKFRFFDDINLQTALDGWSTRAGHSARLHGVSSPPLTNSIYRHPPFASLLSSPRTCFAGVRYARRACGVGEHMLCLDCGLLLLRGPQGPVAAWVREDGRRPYGQRAVDVIAPTIDVAEAFIADLKGLMRQVNRYRGQFLQLRSDATGNVSVDFRPKPVVERDEVVLPDGVLEGIEAHAIGIGRRAAQLAAAGRHLKRGLLLHGPPGTGKTHTVRYLGAQLPEATMFVMAGSAMGWLPFIKDFARDVAPAIVVLDDVDLIAEDRSLPGMAPRSMLFALLDTMDGTREDADILFVCTSNRADTLERAIAARPGRIDHAVEIGLPDASCRERLFALYGSGLDLQVHDMAALLERTEGVTASFIKELLRRALTLALSEGQTAVTDDHVNAALDALLDPANPLTPALLGVAEDTILQRQKHRGTGTAWCGV